MGSPDSPRWWLPDARLGGDRGDHSAGCDKHAPLRVIGWERVDGRVVLVGPGQTHVHDLRSRDAGDEGAAPVAHRHILGWRTGERAGAHSATAVVARIRAGETGVVALRFNTHLDA